MKKIIYLIVFIMLFSGNAFPQSSLFDSARTLISNPSYDYKNPVFYKGADMINYSISDCILSYERWNGDTSNIIARFMDYNSMAPEVEITDDGFRNIGPSVAYSNENSSNNEGMVVFTSNRAGNVNVYYSYYDGATWSSAAPVFADSDERVEAAVTISENFSAKVYLLSYRKGNDIYVTSYQPTGGWRPEYNMTGDDTSSFHNPIIANLRFPLPIDEAILVFLKSNPDSSNSLYFQQMLSIRDTVTYSDKVQITQSGSQENITFGAGFYDDPLINYDFDSAGTKWYYIASVGFGGGYSIFNESSLLPGNNYGGSGMSHGDITADWLFGYTFYTWINEYNDTGYVYAAYDYSSEYKRFMLNDTLADPKTSISTKLVHSPWGKYRVRVLWQDVENGRYVIRESYADDWLTGITQIGSEIPESFSLKQNYPNPFNPSTTIEFQLPSNGRVSINIYDISGKKVAGLINDIVTAGSYKVEWEAGNLSSGIYYYTLSAGNHKETKKMVLLK